MKYYGILLRAIIYDITSFYSTEYYYLIFFRSPEDLDIIIDIARALNYYSMCGWYQLILPAHWSIIQSEGNINWYYPGVWKFSQRYVRIIFLYWTIISMEHVLNKKGVVCRIVDISLGTKNTQDHAKFLIFFTSSVLLTG